MLDERINYTDVENYDVMLDYYKNFSDGFVGAQIDSLTLTFNLDYDLFDLFKSKLLMFRPKTLYDKTQEAFQANLEDHAFLEIDLRIKSRNNSRVDFNPSKIDSRTDEFILGTVLKYAKDINVTRVDVALDYSKDLSNYKLISTSYPLKSVDYKEIRGFDETLETRYLGSRKNKVYRQYNKKLERFEVADVDVVYDDLWRIELECRSKKNLKEIRKAFDDIKLLETTFKNIDISQLSNNDVRNLHFYLTYENPHDFLGSRAIKRCKEIIVKHSKNEYIDLKRDYMLVIDELLANLAKYRVTL